MAEPPHGMLLGDDESAYYGGGAAAGPGAETGGHR
jgi:hypothetical protein